MEAVTLELLATLDAADLRMLWQEHRGTPPPPTLTARQMRHAFAWQLQAKACTAAELSKMQRGWAQVMAERASGVDAPTLAAPAADPGTRLLKEWGGTTHEVIIGEDGTLWNGQHYGSLSAVARAMTGTNRNGPKFFGLRT
jgi:hypothetical protein